MPYITNERRVAVQDGDIQTPGELNYALTYTLVAYLDEHGLSYTTFNDCLGALEGAKLELYRRKIAPYEEAKELRNGDVY